MKHPRLHPYPRRLDSNSGLRAASVARVDVKHPPQPHAVRDHRPPHPHSVAALSPLALWVSHSPARSRPLAILIAFVLLLGTSGKGGEGKRGEPRPAIQSVPVIPVHLLARARGRFANSDSRREEEGRAREMGSHGHPVLAPRSRPPVPSLSSPSSSYSRYPRRTAPWRSLATTSHLRWHLHLRSDPRSDLHKVREGTSPSLLALLALLVPSARVSGVPYSLALLACSAPRVRCPRPPYSYSCGLEARFLAVDSGADARNGSGGQERWGATASQSPLPPRARAAPPHRVSPSSVFSAAGWKQRYARVVGVDVRTEGQGRRAGEGRGRRRAGREGEGRGGRADGSASEPHCHHSASEPHVGRCCGTQGTAVVGLFFMSGGEGTAEESGVDGDVRVDCNVDVIGAMSPATAMAISVSTSISVLMAMSRVRGAHAQARTRYECARAF
ncbi:hypothetical protein B0H16DRAFT_1718690 [Mycena metata]|uniref:Uncharacterized protein n=1 Tax=Mycena metata TaxID=1033252 RepID=A0AAD7NJI8_9AGAR|nr:hypothetical protein B0H16DRAFT_1718690 [Mycena metata]